MKKIISSIITLIAAVGFLGSCEKGDSHYYDFENKTPVYEGTILEYLESQPGVFDSLVLVLDRVPELRKDLGDSNSKLTLFAVTNRSFQIAVSAMNNARALTGRVPLYLEDLIQVELDSIVRRYAFDNTYDTDFLSPFEEGQTVNSMSYGYGMNMKYTETNASGFVGGGQQEIEFSDVNNSIFQRYWKTVNTASVNLRTKNGVIHVLDSGHDFGFNKLTTKFSQ